MALTFPAAYHNRNVIFFSLVYIALLWLIIFIFFFYGQKPSKSCDQIKPLCTSELQAIVVQP